MKLTIADIRKFDPCYDPCEIEGITEATEMTLIEWLEFKSEKLIDKDKVWLASKAMTEIQCRKFAIWCARSCKSKVKEINDYINTIENYYINKTATVEQIKAANCAAYRAAYNAAYRAADWAAYNAADWEAYRAAERAADWAAYNAANSAADRAVYRAGYRATRKAQIKYLINLLKESESK